MSKNFYITTSIPYVNGDPHIGHGLELVQADCIARYARQQGHNVLFSTGSDEHGGKVAEKAAEAGISPQEFADQVSQKFRDLPKTLNVSNDRFIRTTDKAHEDRAKVIWKNLSKDIYKDRYVGMYCTGSESFVTEAVAAQNGGISPHNGKPYERIEEENYFFRLSAYQDQIYKAIESNQLVIQPKTRRNEILHILQQGLEDISISRPKDKISWGISVPGDTSQVMYVWFEALMNYITVLGYPEHDDFTKFWPADVQVLGKDILRFHAAIWPGMLLALGLPLPQALYVHGFVNNAGVKMSKSLGNVVAPSEIVSKYGADTFRYYFLRHIPSAADGDFSWERIHEVYNNELANELGNAVQRTAVMAQKYLDGVVGAMPEVGHDRHLFESAMESFQFDKALEAVWVRVRGVNQLIEEEKPWVIAKEGDTDHLREVLALLVAQLLDIADLLVPFMPEVADKMQAVFGQGVIRPFEGTLFPRLEQTD